MPKLRKLGTSDRQLGVSPRQLKDLSPEERQARLERADRLRERYRRTMQHMSR